MTYDYVIIGGGLAAVSAAEGIRGRDRSGSILILSRENHPPYHRPPLSKDLWFGKSTKDRLPVHEPGYYRGHNLELALRREAVEVDPGEREVWDDHGTVYRYGKLLLATGGRPRRLNVEGGDHDGIRYFRYLEDYLYLESRLEHFRHALVVGGGFIGCELAAALCHAGKEVTLLYPEEYPLNKVLPRELGLFVADYYRERGVEAISGESVVRFDDRGGEVMASTANGNTVTTHLVVVGIGIEPQADLAEAAGLEVSNGIEVDEYGRTSEENVYAAGDVAEFPSVPLDRRMRVEHWDHAIQHGKAVGANMAGANRPYTYLPFFYSDLFDLGWEAVGEVESSLETHAVWKEEFRQGVVYYLRDDVIRGVLLWNTWGAVDWARGLIQEAKPMTNAARVAAVPAKEDAPS
ncbi:MAG TPA: FAD-dependent oxidoreductase [Candidatus Eisenbacteria bacterium]|jgi:NADPH-dependent 2,4-dienoyl-CoA reductase/sulfur reductase-like enzyme